MEVLHKLFKELIVGPLKFKMAEMHHLDNREMANVDLRPLFGGVVGDLSAALPTADANISTKNHPISMKFGTQQHI